MGILDDAIREHLELKRRHGADSQEVSRQEREILGGSTAADEPDVVYDDAPAPEVYAAEEPIAPPIPAEPLAGSPLTSAAPESIAPAGGDIFPGTHELMAAASETPPAPPAPAPVPAPAPATPAASSSLPAPAPADADNETAARSGARRLSDDELAAWRKRLSERADRLAAQRPAAGAPATAAGAASSAPAPAPAKSEPPAYWSGNTTRADAGTPPAGTPAPSLGKPAAPAPEPTAPGVPADFFDAGDAEDAFAPERAPEPVAETPDHDVLDDTPDFLEETPEHDRMWFEQKPPRDFDFG
ncbi:MAG: hypothetical protein JHD16_14190 [Solirubrobacteraceae bacterium]|nr:hypothetical protein [Solirubrobacteraceae bacterium]